MITAAEALHRLGGGEPPEQFAAGWGDSHADLPDRDDPFAAPDRVRAGCALAGIGPSVEAILQRVAERVRSDEALRRVARHAYWRVIESPAPMPLRSWPACDALPPTER